MATSRMDNPHLFPIKGFDSTRRVTLGIRVTTIIVETAHCLGGLTSRRRVMPAVEEILVETETVLTQVEVALTCHIMNE